MLLDAIKTARLHLRRPQVEDAGEIFRRYAQDPEVTRYLTWRPHRTQDETVRFIRECMDAWGGNARYPWIIEKNDDKSVIGMIDAGMSVSKAHIGYVIARDAWGKGYATEALRTVVDRILDMPGMFRVWGVCDVENTASARVMQKAGMEKEGILKRFIIHPNTGLEPCDVFCYAKVR